MAPSDTQTQPAPTMEMPKAPEPVQTKQPANHQAMDPQRPHPEPEMNLRGGDNGRGGCCPGRFCFIIPCPIPCDCCIFPCPC